MGHLSKAVRTRLRAQHRQTVLTAGPGINSTRAFQRMVDRAQVPTARGPITLRGIPHWDAGVVTSPGESASGTAYTPGDPNTAVTILVGPGTEAPNPFDHELGHAFSARNLNDAARQRYMALRHMQAQPWYGIPQSDGERATPTNDADIPEEDFAEVYRMLAMHADKLQSHRAWHNYRGAADTEYVHAVPTFYQARKILRLIDSLG